MMPDPNLCRDRCCNPPPSPDGWLGSLLTLAVLALFLALPFLFGGA